MTRWQGFPPRPPLRRRVLGLAQSVVGTSGLADWYARWQPTAGALILLYHSVAPLGDARFIDPRFRLTRECFEAQMDFLVRRRRVISLHELLRLMLRGDAVEPGTVVITFDDGYRDNFTVALSILRERNLPVTFFLATRYIDEGRPQWIDELYTLFMTRRKSTLEIDIDGVRQSFDVDRPREAGLAYAAISGVLLKTDYTGRLDVLNNVSTQLRGTRPVPRLTATWDEIREAAAGYPLLEFGSHTATHRDLTRASEQDIQREIQESNGSLHLQLGRSPRFFSFPYSRVEPRATSILKAGGIESVVAGDEGGSVTNTFGLFQLPRLEAPASLGRLRMMTSGAYPAVSRTLFGRA